MPELTYRYRLYPTEQQAVDIMRTCSCARFLYNKLLEDRTEHYRQTREWKKLDRSHYEILPFLVRVDPKALAWAQGNLERAYRKFFHALNTVPDRYRPESVSKAGTDPNYKLMDSDLVHYPRFKRKKTTKESYTTELPDLEVQDGRIEIPCIGKVKIRLHRPIPEGARQISCTILKKSSGRYFLLIRLMIPEPKKIKPLEKPLGVVFSYGQLAVRSDDEPVLFRHIDSELERRIQKAYKTLRRRVPGSRRYEQQRLYLARLHEHRVNQRRDDLHKAARQITNAGDTVYLQRPDVLHQLSLIDTQKDRKRLMDEAWWTFSDMVRYKSETDGKQFWLVVRAFPVYSLCSACGHKVSDAKEQEEWKCPNCGAQVPKDKNAAENLKNLAQKYIRETQRA